MSIEMSYNDYWPRCFEGIINGNHCEGDFTDEDLPIHLVPYGHTKYYACTNGETKEIIGITKNKPENFGGTIMLTEPLVIGDEEVLKVAEYTVNNVPYQDFPQIYMECDTPEDKVPKIAMVKLKRLLKKLGDRNFKSGYDDCFGYSFMLECTYEEAEQIVYELNELDKGEWFLGDCHEFYLPD